MNYLRMPLYLFSVILCFLIHGNIAAQEPHETYPPMQEALDAMVSDGDVTVYEETVDEWGEEENFFFAFEPNKKNRSVGFIFYPGGLLDPRSYAPPMHTIAAQGYLTVIVKMPGDLAVFGHTRANQIIDRYPDIERWVIGGHSIGGSFACAFAKEYTEKLEGVVLWGSWPSEAFRLDATNLKAISIYGTRDGHPDEIREGAIHLPADARFVIIWGGNHTQFGWYDTSPDPMQEGDNPARITRERQQKQIINATLGFLNRFATSPCPAELLYGEGSEEVLMLRHFRDTVLSKTAMGQTLIGLYYETSPVLAKIILQGRKLGITVKNLVDAVYPSIRAECSAQLSIRGSTED